MTIPTRVAPQLTTEGDVAVITMDDGKVNVFSHPSLEALHAGLDAAQGQANALVLAGRPGKFSAGFDLAVMAGSPQDQQALVRAGADFLMRLYGYGMPVVAACTGHALAAGAISLLACDLRIGPESSTAKIGMNEVNIGMVIPRFGLELARDRLSKRHLTAATVLGRIYNPQDAVDAGYLDLLVPEDEVVRTAIAHATELAANTRTGAVAGTKTKLRDQMIALVNAGLDEDIS